MEDLALNSWASTEKGNHMVDIAKKLVGKLRFLE